MKHYKPKEILRNLSTIIRNTKNPLEITKKYLKGEKYTIRTENGAKIKGKRGKATLSVLTKRFQEGWRFHPYNNEFYLMKKKGIKLLGKGRSPALINDLQGITQKDIKGKNVMEIGGFFGQTAAMMKIKGADKIIIYEPIDKCAKVIKQIAEFNNWEDDFYIVKKAIGEEKGSMTVTSASEPGSMDFGLEDGEYEVELSTVTWENAIERAVENNVSVIKSNCEGGEKYLKKTPNFLISKVPTWFITAHSKEISKELKEKFRDAGFNVSRYKPEETADTNQKLIMRKN